MSGLLFVVDITYLSISYKIACAASEDLDKPVHLNRLIRVIAVPLRRFEPWVSTRAREGSDPTVHVQLQAVLYSGDLNNFLSFLIAIVMPSLQSVKGKRIIIMPEKGFQTML